MTLPGSWGADGSVSHWFSGPAVMLMDWLGRDGPEYRALSTFSGVLSEHLLLGS